MGNQYCYQDVGNSVIEGSGRWGSGRAERRQLML